MRMDWITGMFVAAALLAGLAATGAGITTARAAIEVREFSSEVEERRFRSLVEELRCTVCQNESLAESDAPLARDLRRQIHQQLQQGRSDQEIRDYLVDRYGDFVLYRPPFAAHTVILWFGPVILLLAGLVATAVAIRRRRKILESS